MKKREVIMLKSIDTIAEAGETVAVSAGYARNYLLPRGYALPNSKYARDLIKSRHKTIMHARLQRQHQAEEYQTQIEAEPCRIRMRASDNGKLFGSVTTHAIIDELAKRGIHLDARAVKIPHNRIHALGEYHIPIRLHDSITATLMLYVEAQE